MNTVTEKPYVLVTGAGGFIGGHLVSKLAHMYGANQIRAVDIKPLEQWKQIFEGVDNVVADLQQIDECHKICEGADFVYNLASDMGGIGFIETNKALCMLSVLINTNMLLASRDAKVSRYFFSSSACVYNTQKQQEFQLSPLSEEDAYPAMPEDGYGWEKLFSERMCRHFREDFGLATRVARFHNVYGPFCTWRGGRDKAPAATCRKVIEAKVQQTKEIEIWGDGNQTRSFMYIDDCIEGIIKISMSDIEQPINLGSSELVTINHLVDLVEEIAEVKLKRLYNTNAPKGVKGRNSDNTKILQLLNWEPSSLLKDGIRETYSWIYEQYIQTSTRKQEAEPTPNPSKEVNRSQEKIMLVQ